MKKKQLGKTGLQVSAITYGGIVSTDDGYDGAFPNGKGQEESDMYVEYAIENGVNYFDVAPKYGNAQGRMGNSLAPYRKDIYLACKTLYRTADDVRRDLEVSLKFLKTDYFDVYQMHALSNVNEVETAFTSGGAMEAILQAKEEGLIRHIGITCHYEEAALRALSLYDFETVMFPTNWALHIRKAFGGKLLEAKREKEFGLLGMKSFIHRAWHSDEERYSSNYPKSWCKPIENYDEWTVAAMKYALSMGIDTLIPPGNFEQFKFAAEHIDECLDSPLSETDTAFLHNVLEEYGGEDFL